MSATDISERLVSAVDRLAQSEGGNPTHLSWLTCTRISQPFAWSHVVYRPSLCVVVQGSKEAVLSGRVYQYNPRQFLALTVPLPLEARVVEASAQRPFLSLALDLDFTQLRDLVARIDDNGVAGEFEQQPAIGVTSMTSTIEECLLRLLQVVENPQECEILAPLIVRELHYRLLESPQGYLLRAAATRDSNAVKAQRVVSYMEEHFDQPLDVPALAAATNMSVSSLHHTFKAATALTPMQYLKRIRLHRARILLMDEAYSASGTAYRVGYNSVAQFSRDFKQQFGLSPSHHKKASRGTVAAPARW